MQEQLQSLIEPVLLEVMHALPPKDLAICRVVSRSLHQIASSSLLWFRVYSTVYRGNFKPPPSFTELAAGTLTELELARFPWHMLTQSHAMLSRTKPVGEQLKGGTLHLENVHTEPGGMIDAENQTERAPRAGWHDSRPGSNLQCVVLQQPLQPLPLARPLAYVELLVHGGASVGLVKRSDYPHHSHVGWHDESLGYNGDNGLIYYSGGIFRFGPTFGFDPELVVSNDAKIAPQRADVVGVGIDFEPNCAEDGWLVFFH
jgi:hypothetical protein